MGLLRETIGTFCADPDEGEAPSTPAIGEHFLAADHGGRTRAQVRARATGLLSDRSGA